MKKVKTPDGYNTVNPFIVTKDAAKYIEFVVSVFSAIEKKEGFTLDNDGKILHAELMIGNSVIMCAESKDGWPPTPGFVQIYVDDVEKTLSIAEKHDATIITKPTDFYGDIFSRMLDPFGNLWWVWQHSSVNIESEVEGDWESSDDASWDETSKELEYIHSTWLEVMPTLGRK